VLIICRFLIELFSGYVYTELSWLVIFSGKLNLGSCIINLGLEQRLFVIVKDFLGSESEVGGFEEHMPR